MNIIIISSFFLSSSSSCDSGSPASSRSRSRSPIKGTDSGIRRFEEESNGLNQAFVGGFYNSRDHRDRERDRGYGRVDDRGREYRDDDRSRREICSDRDDRKSDQSRTIQSKQAIEYFSPVHLLPESDNMELETVHLEKISLFQSTDNSLHEITQQQSAAGSWKPEQAERRFNLKLSEIKLSQIYPFNFLEKNADELLATVFIIAFIQSKYQQQEVIWKMVVHKARLFIIKQLTNIFSMQKSEAINCSQKLGQYATELLANKHYI